MKLSCSFLVIAFLLASCTSPSNSSKNSHSTAKKSEARDGLTLMKQNCFNCHSPLANPSSQIAPTMLEVKQHYLTEGIDKKAFTQTMVAFLANPSKEAARMPQAVNQYGLMPNMGYSEADIQQIAAYLYEHDLTVPNWHKQAKSSTASSKQPETDQEYLEQGKQFALSTKAVLGKNLMGAIKSIGTSGALAFCNHSAYPLTDSMAMTLNAHIKRVSDRPRNPNNRANEQELAYITATKDQLSSGEQAKPAIFADDGKMVGYYPIITNAMCLQCHGTHGREIAAETLEKIAQLYPDDLAKGYRANELRGIWVVEMEKN